LRAKVKVKAEKRRVRRSLKQTISIIGAGRMGTALALALKSRGYRIEAVMAGHKPHARLAAKLMGEQTLALTPAELDRLPQSNLLLITTPDDVIEKTAAHLAAMIESAKTKNAGKHEGARVALHASGALSSDALRSLKRVGFATGSLHPLVSVSDPVHGAESLSTAFFCIEGDPRARAIARSLVRSLGAKSFSISMKDKALYHAAAVMASGHVTALFDVAVEMLARCGLAEKNGREVLLPLLRSTLENLSFSDPAHALTGTFARADAATVRRHLAALHSKEMKDALAVYRLLGLRALKLAKAAGANVSALEEIERLLKVSGRSAPES
jgi:predicted short-subunit dehydrogenase-like oxidoreductase (DUF2520 family)